MNAPVNTYALLASFWEDLKSGSGGPTMIVLMIVAALAIVLIAVVLILFCRRSKIVLDEGDGRKRTIRTGRYKAVKLPQLSKEGYTFGGWYKDAALTEKAEDIVQASSKNLVFYAKWIKEGAEKVTAPAEDAVLAAAEEVQSPEVAAPVEESFSEENAEVREERAEEDVSDAGAPSEEPPAEETPAEDAHTPPTKAEESAAEEAPTEELSEEEAAEAPAEGSPAEETEEETEEEDENETSEGDEIDNALVTLVSGTKVFVQYRRSFRARLIQSDEDMKEYYNRLRSELLSYAGVKERVSWNYDSFNVGRKQFAKVNANRRSLILYLALPPAEVDEKYAFRDVSEKKRYAAVPVRYKVTGSRSFKYACELIEQAAAKFGLDYKRFEETLEIPYEERETLIKQKLIKVYAKRETGETVTEEELEKYIEEGATVESLSAYTVTDRVSVNEAEILISDATAKQLVALAEEASAPRAQGARAKRSYVNLDTVSANFREGDRVDLAALQAKGLVEKKATAYKVLARGSLDKSLIIEANDFSLPAVKMIALTGGKVIKIKKD